MVSLDIPACRLKNSTTRFHVGGGRTAIRRAGLDVTFHAEFTRQVYTLNQLPAHTLTSKTV